MRLPGIPSLAAGAAFAGLLTASAGDNVSAVKTRTETARAEVRVHESQTLGRITRQVTGDLTLARAVEIALRQNPEILKAIQEIERSRGVVIEARSDVLPHIALTGNYQIEDRRLHSTGSGNTGNNSSRSIEVPDNIDPAFAAALGPLFAALSGGNASNRRVETPDQSYQITLEMRQHVYAGGRIRASVAAAKFAEDSAYFTLHDVIDQVVARVRSQFYNVLATRALITVQEETVHLQEDLLKDQKNRFEAGTVPRFNVIRAEVELANVVPNLIRARNVYLIAQIDLAKSLGLDPGPAGHPTFYCAGELGVPVHPLSLVDSLALARARRPSLKAQRQNILAQAERVKVALAGYKPTLDATAGYEIRNSNVSNNLDRTIDGWFVGVQGNWNIFDGFLTYGQVKDARAQLEEAKINYDDSVQQVELEVQQAYTNVQQSREVVESQRKNIEQAREALRLANERLAAGAGTQLELLDARVALTSAQTTELQARSDYNKALAEFDRATGLDTVYENVFKDPLAKLEAKILGDRWKWDFHPLTPARKAIDQMTSKPDSRQRGR